jgi:hypothetical protein
MTPLLSGVASMAIAGHSLAVRELNPRQNRCLLRASAAPFPDAMRRDSDDLHASPITVGSSKSST